MMDENPVSAERLRAYVDKWLSRAKWTERIMLWVLHFLVFVIFFLGAQPLSAADWLLAIGWLIGLVIHAVAIWMESSAGERYLRRGLAERGIRELYAEVATSAALADPDDKKAKRDSAAMLTLSDDGELVPVDEAANDTDAGTMRRSG